MTQARTSTRDESLPETAFPAEHTVQTRFGWTVHVTENPKQIRARGKAALHLVGGSAPAQPAPGKSSRTPWNPKMSWSVRAGTAVLLAVASYLLIYAAGLPLGKLF